MVFDMESSESAECEECIECREIVRRFVFVHAVARGG